MVAGLGQLQCAPGSSGRGARAAHLPLSLGMRACEGGEGGTPPIRGGQTHVRGWKRSPLGGCLAASRSSSAGGTATVQGNVRGGNAGPHAAVLTKNTGPQHSEATCLENVCTWA